MNDTLENWRKQIDSLDEQLLQILSKRMDIVKKIGELKQSQGIPFLDEDRWQEVLESRSAQAELLGLPKDFVKTIYILIHDLAIIIEETVRKK